ncbi:f17beb48-3f0b-45fa-891a-a00480ad50b1 [Thermothielavioides terrestris]|uniref:Nuclear pore complex protein n=1 Tax=Thermothielavioides terrestris TaxID=2587410 RepID=A0A3S4ETW4_9PEZI|nr:f17beb48-3f0b-45fa-891a-a00480ad50b1 [Thermothielavioides terrestris]
MAPAFRSPASDGTSRASSQSPAQGPLRDEMSDLEATYQESTIRAGEEVDYFAAQLDRYSTDLTGSPAENRAHVFKLVDSYYTYSRKRADRLPDDSNSGATPEDVRRAEEEAQTWDLLRRILPLRYRDTTAAQPAPAGDNSTRTRRQWWNEFLISDSTARERKIVLEWLQSSASYRPPIDEVVSELQQNAERGDIVAHGWLHTRHKIKLQKSVNGYQGVLDPNDAAAAKSHLGSSTLVTQLDPDAVTRQARKLEPQDEFFERAIWLGCFEMLRRGCPMSKIRDWCSERTELWRAASIAPLPLSNPEDDEQLEFEPSSLVLWRRMCFAAARDGGTGDYDKAVYGLLAGDIASVERVCRSWDDFLFAQYNALLRTQFDLYLTKHGGADAVRAAERFPSFNAVLHHSDPMTVSKRLIASLEADPRTSKEATRTAKALQGAIVANEVDRHLFHQGVVLSRHANQKQKSKLIPEVSLPHMEKLNQDKYFDLSDHDGLRVLAHVLIIISTLDHLSGFTEDRGDLQVRHQAQENIIAAYISYLRLANLEEMIPLYCSKLQGARMYETLSRNLIHIVDNDARVHQLTIMRKLGLDLAEFVTSQPPIYLGDVQDSSLRCEAKGQFKILENGPATLKYGRVVKPDFFGEDAEFVDQEDELIIRAMEWLLCVPGLFVETCTYAVRVYKYFLKRMRLRAARAFSQRVSGWEIARTKSPVLVKEATENPGPGWFEEFVSGEFPADFLAICQMDKEKLINLVRNVWELECLVRALDSIETLSSVAGLSREESNASREMWRATSQEVRSAKACMQPVLRNWLLVSNEVDEDFQELRAAYIPETVLAYISCLHFAGTSLSRDNLLECMELAAVIAEKGSDVAQEFMACNRMKELVEAFASCSKALAIWTSDKKGSQTSSKKIREMGWSRELWSIKP